MSRYISKVEILNYKCFRRAEASLGPGLNIVLGKNNSGKSALLEVLAFDREPNSSFSPSAGSPQMRLELVTDSAYFAAKLESLDLPRPSRAFMEQEHLSTDQEFLDWLCSKKELRVGGSYDIDKSTLEITFPSISLTYSPELTSHDRFNCLDWQREKGGRLVPTGSSSRKRPTSDFGLREFEQRRAHTYFFRPDRIAPSGSFVSSSGELDKDGANLGGVVSYLQGESRLGDYVQLVQRVFPEIEGLTAKATTDGRVEAFLWPIIDRSNRAIPLRKCGRGVAPVLALLYVLFTAPDDDCTFIIDEPQAFLHPGALRRLLAVIKQYPQHQFILSTHSPIVLSAAGAARCLVVRQEKGESTIESVEPVSGAASARAILAEVGASLQDVFGAEGVVWVEGPTEAFCFERLLASDSALDSKGLAVLPLRAVGDLTGGQRKVVAEIYRRMTQGNALLPPSLAFQFDREDRSESARQELTRQIGVPTFFTKRRMYENYLLQPGALAWLLNEVDIEQSAKLTPEDVDQWLKNEEAAWRQQPSRNHLERWIEDAPAGEVLKKLFGALSEKRCEYRKTEHGPRLTNWLIENSPNDLEELRQLLKDILKACGC